MRTPAAVLISVGMAIGLVAIGLQSYEIWQRWQFTKMLWSALGEDPAAQYNIGKQYELGSRHVKKDFTRASEFYRRAADRGHGRAQLRLGLLYAAGDGVPKDYKRAEKLIRKAVAKGIPEAYTSLGFILYNTDPNNSERQQEAMSWFEKGAQRGDSYAFLLLALYPKTDFNYLTDEDEVRRYKWLVLATKHKQKGAVILAVGLRLRMEPEQIHRAVALADEWQKRYGKR